MKRSTLLLIGILVVLVGVAYLVTLKPGETSTEAIAGAPLVHVDSAAVTKISIDGSNGHVQLEKRGVEWFVSSPVDDKADASSVGVALQKASALNIKSIVSSRPEKHGLFQVDSTGTRVTFATSSGDSTTIIVGKNSSSFGETYVRKDGSNDVALIDGSLSFVFNKPLKDWRNRKLLDLSRESITTIRYQYGDTTFTVSFADSSWMIGQQKADQGKVNSLITTLTSLQCDDFVDGVPQGKIMAQVDVGGAQFSFVYNKETKKYEVRSSAGNQWYVMEPWRAEQVLKRKKDLL